MAVHRHPFDGCAHGSAARARVCGLAGRGQRCERLSLRSGRATGYGDPSCKFWVSRHRCGQGESAIVVMSRIFVPGKGFASRARVDRVAEVDVLTRRSPSGRRSLPTSGAGPGSQGWPGGPSAASRAAASLTARNSAATREIASDQLPMERGSVARAHPRSGRVASSVVSVCRASQATRSHGQKAET